MAVRFAEGSDDPAIMHKAVGSNDERLGDCIEAMLGELFAHRPGRHRAGWDDAPWLLDMGDEVERGGTYALIFLATLEHWNTLFPDERDVDKIIPDPEAAWDYAREYRDFNKPAPQRKWSLEGHVKHKARDRERVQRRRAAAKSMDKGKQARARASARGHSFVV